MTTILPREVLIYTIARLLDGVRHVAVGASSPIPAAGAMLLRAIKAAKGELGPRISILGSVEHNFFTKARRSFSIAQLRDALMHSFLAAAKSTGSVTSIS